MAMSSPTTSARKAVHKLDVEKVSLNLQDRLGLAKVKYEKMFGLNTDPMDGSEDNTPRGKHFLSTPDGHRRFATPATSTPITSPILTKDLPRSARSKHAAMFDIRSMEAMTSGSRKRRRCDSITEEGPGSEKLPRSTWVHDSIPPSSPTMGRQRPSLLQKASFVSQADTIPDDSLVSPDMLSEHEIDPELPTSASLLSSSPPRTPPSRHNRFLPADDSHQDGADLLLYLANSPTPATLGEKGRLPDLFPSTPPTRNVYLPSLLSTPGGGIAANFNTPGQPFNFADFVNVTPSPAQRQWGNTPRVPPKTPITMRDVRKRLNFDALAPPAAASPNSKSPDRKVGLALQLGEELHF